MSATPSYILRISCPDTVGIVARVSSFLADSRAFIEESSHYGDADTMQFFMRTRFRLTGDNNINEVIEGFGAVAEAYDMQWDLRPNEERSKVIIMVSKQDHCINDLLYKVKSGSLKMDVVAVVSNHKDLMSLCQWYNLPFYHVPVTLENKQEAEEKLSNIVSQYEADLVILARYMQILSERFCTVHSGHIINIHHSFLPSFKGARPYHRAYEKGVKLIGATAHYVTSDLDEGPIIEQVVERVTHVHHVEELVSVGKDVECLTLARAVKYHIEGRVFLNGAKTVVFK